MLNIAGINFTLFEVKAVKDNYIGHFNNVKMVAAPLMIHLLANVAKRTQKFDKYILMAMTNILKRFNFYDYKYYPLKARYLTTVILLVLTFPNFSSFFLC